MEKQELSKTEIGELAGKVWRYLEANGKTGIIKLKIDLRVDNSKIFLALGWLARENKLLIERTDDGFFVSLIKNTDPE